MSISNEDKELYGPLANLIGIWEGDKGLDIAPEKTGEEKSPYFETITIEGLGTATNASEQTLAVLAYKQVVSRISTGDVFHHQTGYWYWDKSTQDVLYSLLIPRAVAVLARGKAQAKGSAQLINVRASAPDKNYGILESTFMAAKASTRNFEMDVTVDGNSLQYTMKTGLYIYERDFMHTDINTLSRKR